MPEYSSVLTFEDLIVEAARKLGTAYYGAAGDEHPQIPRNTHDLWLAKDLVNTALRDFVASAPPQGWKWLHQLQRVTLWPSVAVSATALLTSGGYDPTSDTTLLISATDAFYPSMEMRDIVLTGIGTFRIEQYVSASQIRVLGNATAAGVSPGVTWSITSTGAYTLPATFSGQATGDITYAPGESHGVIINWTEEAVIRRSREITTAVYGYPFLAAVRQLTIPSSRQRWELLVYPTPQAVQAVEFPFTLYFTKLEDLNEVLPAPFSHDETLRAAVRAVVERQEMGGPGPDEVYYRKTCLPNSYNIDFRSAPKSISTARRYSSIQDFRHNTQRQTVLVN